MREDVAGKEGMVGMQGIETLRMCDINGKYKISAPLNRENDCVEARRFNFRLLSRNLGYPDPR